MSMQLLFKLTGQSCPRTELNPIWNFQLSSKFDIGSKQKVQKQTKCLLSLSTLGLAKLQDMEKAPLPIKVF